MPGTAPLTSHFALLISTTTTKVEIGSNAIRLRLRSLTWAIGATPSVRMDDEGATTSDARPIASPKLACQIGPSLIQLRLSLLPAFPSRDQVCHHPSRSP